MTKCLPSYILQLFILVANTAFVDDKMSSLIEFTNELSKSPSQAALFAGHIDTFKL